MESTRNAGKSASSRRRLRACRGAAPGGWGGREANCGTASCLAAGSGGLFGFGFIGSLCLVVTISGSGYPLAAPFHRCLFAAGADAARIFVGDGAGRAEWTFGFAILAGDEGSGLAWCQRNQTVTLRTDKVVGFFGGVLFRRPSFKVLLDGFLEPVVSAAMTAVETHRLASHGVITAQGNQAFAVGTLV